MGLTRVALAVGLLFAWAPVAAAQAIRSAPLPSLDGPALGEPTLDEDRDEDRGDSGIGTRLRDRLRDRRSRDDGNAAPPRRARSGLRDQRYTEGEARSAPTALPPGRTASTRVPSTANMFTRRFAPGVWASGAIERVIASPEPRPAGRYAAITARIRQALLRGFLDQAGRTPNRSGRVAGPELAAAEFLLRSGDAGAVTDYFALLRAQPVRGLDAAQLAGALVASRARLASGDPQAACETLIADVEAGVAAAALSGGRAEPGVADTRAIDDLLRRGVRFAGVCAALAGGWPVAERLYDQARADLSRALPRFEALRNSLGDDRGLFTPRRALGTFGIELRPRSVALSGLKPVGLEAGLLASVAMLGPWGAERQEEFRPPASLGGLVALVYRASPALAAALARDARFPPVARAAALIKALHFNGLTAREARAVRRELARGGTGGRKPDLAILDLAPADGRSWLWLSRTALEVENANAARGGQVCEPARQLLLAGQRMSLDVGVAAFLRAGDRSSLERCAAVWPRVVYTSVLAGVAVDGRLLTELDWHWRALAPVADLSAPGGARLTNDQNDVLRLGVLAPEQAARFQAVLDAQSGRRAVDIRAADGSPLDMLLMAGRSRDPISAALATIALLDDPPANLFSPQVLTGVLNALADAGLAPMARDVALAALLPAWPDRSRVLVQR